MRTKFGTLLLVLAIATATAAVSGCKKADTSAAADGAALWPFSDAARQGRYVGVGIYSPGVTWTKMVANHLSAAPAVANLADDQAIIVTTDSKTGEVRACGDLSGYCVGMNPWRTELAASQVDPVRLTEHGNPATAEAANTADNDAAASAPASTSGR